MAKLSAKYINSQNVNIMLPDGINVSIDPVADVLYIKFKEAVIDRSLEEKDGILLDLDKHGGLVGISIVHPKKFSLERTRVYKRIASKFHMPGMHNIHPSHLAQGYTLPPAHAHA